MRSWRVVRGLAVMLVGLLAPGWAGAADAPRREGRSLEFRADLPWARLALEGGDDIAGVAPLRVPGPLVGDFWLVADAPGVETQRGRVRIDLDEAGSRLVSYGSPPFHETFMRSALFPGYAQFRTGQRGKGALLGMAGAAAVTAAIWAQAEFWDADDRVDAAQLAIAASGDVNERERLRQELLDAQEDKTFAGDRRSLCFGALGAAWGVSILDAIAFGPDFHVTQADEATLSVGLRPKTRHNALLRSVLFPGLGQEYNGRHHKAFLVGCAGLGTCAWFLHAQNDYNRSVADFEKVRRRYEESTSVDERRALLDRQRVLFEDVDDHSRARKVALGAVGGVWLASLLDTAVDFGNAWGGAPTTKADGGLGLFLEPNGAVGARWGF